MCLYMGGPSLCYRIAYRSSPELINQLASGYEVLRCQFRILLNRFDSRQTLAVKFANFLEKYDQTLLRCEDNDLVDLQL